MTRLFIAPATPGLLNIQLEVLQTIQIYTFSATLGHNGIFIIIFFKATSLKCIFSNTWSSDIFFVITSGHFFACPPENLEKKKKTFFEEV